MVELGPRHPYADVNLVDLDGNFPSILAHAAAPGINREEQVAGREGLTDREKRLFRLGLLAGLGEWQLAIRAMGDLLDEGVLTEPEVRRAVAEAGLVKGWMACAYLSGELARRGIDGPASVAEAVAVSRDLGTVTVADKAAGLTDREVFAMGLGLTWGAKCWDT